MFKILDYLGKLQNVKNHSTWYEATCPVCSGKLKISRAFPKEGSYACYTGYCHELKTSKGINLIRKALEDTSPFRQYSSHFKQPRIFQSSMALKPVPIHISTELSLLSKVPYVRPRVELEESKRTIYFDYGEFQLVRVETVLGEITSKYVYPIHYRDNSNFYHKGLPAVVQMPFYRKEYIAPDLLIVEGEKCASLCQKLGLSCISVYTPYASSYMLDNLMAKLYTEQVRNVVYLEDNDIPGKTKAFKLLDSAWKAGIAANSINVTDIYTVYKDCQGFDIVDLYMEDCIDDAEDILHLIERGLHG